VLRVMQRIHFISPTKGWFLSDTCSKIRGDDPPIREFLVFDTVGINYSSSTGVPVSEYPYYAEDGSASNGVSLYVLNEEESRGCEGYKISFGVVWTGYAGGEQFTEATPFRDYWFNKTIGCQYDTCQNFGQICKYEEDGDENAAYYVSE
jgi:hypothetical protein